MAKPEVEVEMGDHVLSKSEDEGSEAAAIANQSPAGNGASDAPHANGTKDKHDAALEDREEDSVSIDIPKDDASSNDDGNDEDEAELLDSSDKKAEEEAKKPSVRNFSHSIIYVRTSKINDHTGHRPTVHLTYSGAVVVWKHHE